MCKMAFLLLLACNLLTKVGTWRGSTVVVGSATPAILCSILLFVLPQVTTYNNAFNTLLLQIQAKIESPEI